MAINFSLTKIFYEPDACNSTDPQVFLYSFVSLVER